MRVPGFIKVKDAWSRWRLVSVRAIESTMMEDGLVTIRLSKEDVETAWRTLKPLERRLIEEASDDE